MKFRSKLLFFLFVFFLNACSTINNKYIENELYCEYDSDCILVEDCECGIAVNKYYAENSERGSTNCADVDELNCPVSYSILCQDNMCNKRVLQEPAISEPRKVVSVNQQELFITRAPADIITENQIDVFNNYVIIRKKNIFWASYADTNSMVPVLDYGANGLEFIPDNIDDIRVGDIISFIPDSHNFPIVHRVVEINYDEIGWYARTKGDSNPVADDWKVRFEQVEGVVFAIIY